MEQKTSKVTYVENTGRTWETHGKIMYVYEVQFENKDKGQYSSTSENQNKFIKDQEIDYTIETRNNNGYTNMVIKPVQQNTFGGGKKYDTVQDLKRQKVIVAQNSMTNASNLVGNGKIDIKDLSKYAELMYSWAMTKYES